MGIVYRAELERVVARLTAGVPKVMDWRLTEEMLRRTRDPRMKVTLVRMPWESDREDRASPILD